MVLRGERISNDPDLLDNLQVWVESDYDTRVLHSNIAFPLLKELFSLGVPQARFYFLEEIIKRFESAFLPVVAYLIENQYLDYLPDDYFRSFVGSERLKKKILFDSINSKNKKFWLISLYLFNKLFPFLSSLDIEKYISFVKNSPSLVFNILYEPLNISLCAVHPSFLYSIRKVLINDLIKSEGYKGNHLDKESLILYLEDLSDRKETFL